MSSTWRPRTAVEISTAQCADPRERLRLWREYDMKWVRIPPPASEGPTITEEKLPGWLEEHGYPELAASYKCHATTAKGTRCRSSRRAGSRYCGTHEKAKR
jgi:hypothetical protein